GNDTITGFWTDDTLDGGAGNDLLRGLGGGDTYLFGKGYGQDSIEESIATVYEDYPDKVLFASSITRPEVTFRESGSDLIIAITGTTDQLTVKNHFSSTYNAVESFQFANGTVMTKSEVDSLALQTQATSGNDTINGTANADPINALAG